VHRTAVADCSDLARKLSLIPFGSPWLIAAQDRFDQEKGRAFSIIDDSRSYDFVHSVYVTQEHVLAIRSQQSSAPTQKQLHRAIAICIVTLRFRHTLLPRLVFMGKRGSLRSQSGPPTGNAISRNAQAFQDNATPWAAAETP
jgi:hypothetical protein